MPLTSDTPAKKSNDSVHRRFRVLVVGDWVVDDYWVTGLVHRSPTASRIGRTHLKGLNHPNSTLQALVGAGRIGSLLHSATEGTHHLFEVVGLGLWHRNDTPLIRAMFDRSNLAGWTPNQLSRSKPNTKPSGI